MNGRNLKRIWAVLLAVFLVMAAAAACNVSDPSTSAASPETTTAVPETTEEATTVEPATEEPTTEEATTEEPTTEEPTTEAPMTEEPTTEAPTTEAPTTEAPTTEAPTTEAPTTTAPTTEAPTEPEKPEFRTGLYEFKAAGTNSPGDLNSASLYFNEIGQVSADLNYADYGGSYSSYQYGHYVVDGNTVRIYYWFSGGSGGVGFSATMYATDELTIESDSLLSSKTLVQNKKIELAFSNDPERTMRESFDNAVSSINNKYMSNDRYQGAPADLPKPPKLNVLYTFPGQSGRLLGSSELGLFEDGRFCLTTSFTDGAGGGTMVGNYVKKDDHIYCYVWFSQAGDPVYYATENSSYDFWITEDGKLLLQNLSDTHYLYYEVETDSNQIAYVGSAYDIRRTIQYGYIDFTPKS